MKNPSVIIFSGYGLNCEEETRIAFEKAGARPSIVHLNDIIAHPTMLRRAEIVAFPGGFSYGDDTGSGKAYGNRVMLHLRGHLEKFLRRNTLMIGICNGFQILTNAGILPGALLANDGGRFLCRWVDVKVSGTSPWLKGISELSLPIAHGEGRYYVPAKQLREMKARGNIALRYTMGPLSTWSELPANPNGALDDIAGVTGYDGRVLGLMPHPERAIRTSAFPNYANMRDAARRRDERLPVDAQGLKVFKNAVRYFF